MMSQTKAALWMIGAISSFTAMAIAGRAVSAELDTFEIMTYRSFVGIFLVVVISRLMRTHRQINTEQLGLHFTRNFFHFAGQNLWFFALSAIPLAQVIALEFTSPLWAMLLAPLILSEKITAQRIIAAAVGFVGVLIVARPDPSAVELGQITAALAAIGFAMSALLTRRLTRTQSITTIMFYLTVFQAVFGVVCAGIDGDMAVPTWQAVPWLVLIGCSGLVAHFCLTSALSLAPATLVMPIDFARLPVMAFVGWALYSEQIDLFVVGGALIIFGANYYNILSETRASKRVS
ncbi:MAG: DMT family transporter [Thalassovita sp.]